MSWTRSSIAAHEGTEQAAKALGAARAVALSGTGPGRAVSLSTLDAALNEAAVISRLGLSGYYKERARRPSSPTHQP